MSEFKVGDVVRHSGHAIKPKRDYWLGCGREPFKSAAKTALETMLTERGTIIEVKPPSRWNNGSLVVQWNNGLQSNCLSYLVEASS